MAGSSHGHTPAAWTGATITFIGFCIGGVFVVAADPVGFWAGIGVVFLGGIVGLVMKAMGLGMPKESAEVAHARAEAGRAQSRHYATAPAAGAEGRSGNGEAQKETQSH
ncbi:HGxxPAAW family protein [Streptomyces sp. 150FB]|uniref:HGxxPAAW family protein n=1 Tax=Streptomyces sp. 150FB TaxID=1576605 RepID=UPI0006986B02|nr:HGxxPAAW family protein [Streptomyces sp. 150FB]